VIRNPGEAGWHILQHVPVIIMIATKKAPPHPHRSTPVATYNRSAFLGLSNLALKLLCLLPFVLGAVFVCCCCCCCASLWREHRSSLEYN